MSAAHDVLMARCYEEVSSSQVEHRRVTPRETPTTSSLVAGRSVEELRFYCQAPIKISLEISNGPATSIVGEADNAIYFTWEQFAAGLHFPVSSLVKRFLHFTRAPLVLVYPNVFSDSNGL